MRMPTFRETVWFTRNAVLAAFLASAAAVLIYVRRVTLPKFSMELDEAQRASLEAGLTAMESRKLLAAENKALPITQGKVNAAIDNAGAAMKSLNVLIVKLDANQDEISESAVGTLNALKEGINSTAKSVQEVGTQTAASAQAITDAANAVGQTANAAAQTANATTATANSVTETVKASEPQIVQTSKNVQDATGNVAGITKEGKQWVHSFLHPKWPKAVFGGIEDFAAKILGSWL